MSQITKLAATVSAIQTITGNTGGPVGPTGNNINIVGGAGVLVAGNPGTSTLVITTSGVVPIQFDTDTGTAIPAFGVLQILGGNNIQTTGAADTVSVALTDNVSISGTFEAASATIQNLGIGTVRSDVNGLLSSLVDGTDGMLLISSSIGTPIWATLTPGTGIAITNGANSISIEATGGGGGINSVSGTVNQIDSTGSPDVTLSLSSTLVAPGSVEVTTNLIMPAANNTGTQGLIHLGPILSIYNVGGTSNFLVANSVSLAAGATDDFNIAIGNGAFTNLQNQGATYNVALGKDALSLCFNSFGNVAIGFEALKNNSNSYNVAIGHQALKDLQGNNPVTQGYHIALGFQAGANLNGNTTDASNIYLNSPGTGAGSESNVLRLGNGTGSGIQQLSAAFVSGIYGITPGGTLNLVTIDNDGQLGSSTATSVTGSLTLSSFMTASSGDITIVSGDLQLPVNTSTSVGVIRSYNLDGGGTPQICSLIHKYGNSGASNSFNLFVGDFAGNFSMTVGTCRFNTAVGSATTTKGALGSLTTGTANTGMGFGTLLNTTTGNGNCALGANALINLVSGNANIAIGINPGVDFAGAAYTGAESSNIVLNSTGVTGESNVLRIGQSTGGGATQLNAAYIAGINGITVTGTAVLVSASDQLGIAVSSRRYKENIIDMDEYSSAILKLRPVTFNYVVGDDFTPQSGLIAEEVAEIMPSLVVNDKEGLPQTVKYHDLAALLLNEIQKLHKRIAVLEAKDGNG
jgi:hypothetical protein